MITYQVNGQGPEITMDEKALMFPEGLELERQAGIGSNKYMQQLAEGSTTASAAMLWLGAVRTAAARDGVNFRTAAESLPFMAWAETLDLLATMTTVRRPAAEADPTAPVTSLNGSPETTSPATSEPAPPGTPSPADASATSESSPSSSESAPGSGNA